MLVIQFSVIIVTYLLTVSIVLGIGLILNFVILLVVVVIHFTSYFMSDLSDSAAFDVMLVLSRFKANTREITVCFSSMGGPTLLRNDANICSEGCGWDGLMTIRLSGIASERLSQSNIGGHQCWNS